jgi:transposase-like protein
MENTVVRYSEAFKLQVVSELESGKFKCIFEARRRYAIRGVGTVERWIRKYGKKHLLKRVVRVETTNERDQLRAMREKIRKLESALSDAHIDLRLERAWFELACEAGGIEDIESFKKKAHGMLSTNVQKGRRICP